MASMLEFLKKILKREYKEKGNKVTYLFGEKEVGRILSVYLLQERKLIDEELFDIESTSYLPTKGEMTFTIKEREYTPPPPPPDKQIAPPPPVTVTEEPPSRASN